MLRIIYGGLIENSIELINKYNIIFNTDYTKLKEIYKLNKINMVWVLLYDNGLVGICRLYNKKIMDFGTVNKKYNFELLSGLKHIR